MDQGSQRMVVVHTDRGDFGQWGRLGSQLHREGGYRMSYRMNRLVCLMVDYWMGRRVNWERMLGWRRWRATIGRWGRRWNSTI